MYVEENTDGEKPKNKLIEVLESDIKIIKVIFFKD